ncbi:hypothetical protein AcW1_008503 [Taiwanofungus camphoratus]|nr:hypothetical protein AcW1_008503 [Antrodia cinnamomea]
MNANVTQLQAPQPQTELQHVSREAEEKGADFLVLRLLNKRGRVRLSPEFIDLEALPGQGRLFAVANSKGFFAAATRNAESRHELIFSPLFALRSAFASTPTDGGEIEFQPQRRISLLGVPNILTFADNETRLLVALTNGSIMVFDTLGLLTVDVPSPLYTFSSSEGVPIRQMFPNPGDMPELIAVLRGNHDSDAFLPVEILDVRNMQSIGGWRGGGTPASSPTTLAWSPKGKQLALGLQNGEIVTFSPTETSAIKSIVPQPRSLSDEGVISATWLSNSEFYAIYTTPGNPTSDVEQSHFIVTLDSKTNTAADVKFNSPYVPFPGLRPPGSFVTVLRNWASARCLVFIGDSTSSDIGLIGSLADTHASLHETWYNLSLEETSTPTVPLDRDMNDTVLLALELDLTAKETYHYTSASGEESDVPPPPVLYAYASDGTVVGWQVIHTQGIPYPGMVAASTSAPVARNGESIAPQSASVSPTSSARDAPSPFVQSSGSIFSQTASTTTMPFSAVFGTSTMGSALGAGPSQKSAGFGAFSGDALKFGQTGFAFGTNQNPKTMSDTAERSPVSPITEDAMASDTDADTDLGGLSLGGDNSVRDQTKTGAISMFGQFSSVTSSSAPNCGTGPSVSAPGATSALGSSDIRPARGFGAFANQGFSAFGTDASSGTSASFGSTDAHVSEAKSSVATTQSSSSPQLAFGKPAAGFGQPSFGQPSLGQPVFGKSAFGQSTFGQPAFGQPAFRQSAFGQPAFGQTTFGAQSLGKPAANDASLLSRTSSPGASSGSGFGAFAQAGPVTFGTALSKAGGSPGWLSTANDNTAAKDKDDRQPSKSASGGDNTTSTLSAEPSGQLAVTSSSWAPAGNTHLTPASEIPSPSDGSPASSSVSSPFNNSSSTGSGAFGSLTTSPFGFGKLNAGFGAFSRSDTTSSPFFRASTPPERSSLPSPALASIPAPTTTIPKSESTRPVFGSTSMLGQTKSGPFGKASPVPSTDVSSLAPGGGFAAFSGASAGFGAASAAGKSFGDLLRQSSDVEDQPKVQKSVFSKPSDGTPSRLAAKSSTYGDSEKPQESAHVFSVFTKDSTSQGSSHDKEIGSPSTASSPVRVSEPASHEDEDIAPSDDHAEVEVEDDTAFLSDSFSEESGSESAEETPVEDNLSLSVPPASYSTIPKHGSPISLTSLNIASTTSLDQPDKAKVREGSTTPPGSPVKLPSPPVSHPSTPTSVPVSHSSSASPLGLGLGRPSTRPARSSPLASAPINGDDEGTDEDAPRPSTAETSGPITLVVKPGQSDDSQTRPRFDVDAQIEESAKRPRPKTPPILFGTPPLPIAKPFSLTTPGTSSTSDVTKPVSPVPLASVSGPRTVAAPGPGNAPLPTLAVAASPIQDTSLGIDASSSDSIDTDTLRRGRGSMTVPSQPPFLLSDTLPKSRTSVLATSVSSASSSGVPRFPSPVSLDSRKPTSSLSPPTISFVTDTSRSVQSSDTSNQASAEGMQAECASLFHTLTKELEELRVLAHDAGRRSEIMSKSSTDLRTSADLSDSSKWVVADVVQFGHTMRPIPKEIEELEHQKTGYISEIQDLESSMLKATTRKQEIVRFSKASKDVEFARMLKARTLGPEHLETQSQLRRDIRVLRDRVQQLEDHIGAAKKRLTQLKTGKTSMKAPSLSTINRIYRNIDVAIEQQEDSVAQLTARAEGLKLDRVQKMRAWDRGVPNKRNIRLSEVTPSVAMSTAAALNAEMSAHKLKRALLKTRKEPLLNTQAISAPSPSHSRSVFRSPVRAGMAASSPLYPPSFESISTAMARGDGMKTGRLNSSSDSEGSISSSSGIGSRRRSTSTNRHHAPPVQMKKTPSNVTPSPSKFSWGPLPGVTPMKTLPADVRKKSPSASSPSLSSSWVMDGFGKQM